MARERLLAARRGARPRPACPRPRAVRSRRARAPGRRASRRRRAARRPPVAPAEPRDLAARVHRWRGARDRDGGRLMRILWVKIGGLWPPDRGGRLRSYHTIAELGRRHRVTVATTHLPGETPDSVDTLPNAARVLSFPHHLPKQGSPAFALALARSWVSTLPVDLSKARVPALERGVRGLLASGAVDVCVADFLAAWPNVPARSGVPIVLFEHNVEHAIWQRLA